MTGDNGPTCIRCGYNLTALTGNTCPECGWSVDWDLARVSGDDWRCGTPAYRARGWRVIDQTLLTLLMMLFAPWKFARQLRPDESIFPPLAVALLSFGGTFAPPAFNEEWREIAVYGAAVTAVILCQTLCFSTLYFRRGPRRVRWRQRFRLWLLVSLYSTCFVGTWRLTDGPPLVGSLTTTSFYWPLSGSSSFFGKELDVTVIFYWWWAILGTTLIVRTRPRWLAVLALALVFVFSWIGYQVGFLTYEWLE